MSTPLSKTLTGASVQLTHCGIPTPELDAEILLASAIKKPKEFLYTHPEYALSKAEDASFEKLLRRRLKHEPIAYIINQKEFYGYLFYVDRRVLIPRPETETIVDNALALITKFPQTARISIADIGTGSGCIIISIALELRKNPPPQSIVFFAVDSSRNALAVAKRNARGDFDIKQRIAFLCGSLLEPLAHHPSFISADHCIIVANLPYITPKVFKKLAPEITQFEPHEALVTPTNDPEYWYKKIEAQIERLQKRTKWHTFFERA